MVYRLSSSPVLGVRRTRGRYCLEEVQVERGSWWSEVWESGRVAFEGRYAGEESCCQFPGDEAVGQERKVKTWNDRGRSLIASVLLVMAACEVHEVLV